MTSAAISAGRSSGVRRSPGSGDSSVPRRGRRPRRRLTGGRLRWVLAGRLPAGGDGRALLREGDDPFRRGRGSEAVRERAIEVWLVITLRRRGRRMQASACGEPGTEPCAPTHRVRPRPRQAGCAKAQGLVRGPPPPLIWLCRPRLPRVLGDRYQHEYEFPRSRNVDAR